MRYRLILVSMRAGSAHLRRTRTIGDECFSPNTGDLQLSANSAPSGKNQVGARIQGSQMP